jgi:hypothetical protein
MLYVLAHTAVCACPTAGYSGKLSKNISILVAAVYMRTVR